MATVAFRDGKATWGQGGRQIRRVGNGTALISDPNIANTQ